ncbi:MAG: FIST C-terminal domain-containing protein [Thermoleophilia bacterium]
MELTTLEYTREGGWSAPLPEWDSPGTLVVAFGAPEYRDDWTPFRQLAEAYPASHILGCSTAGEIHGACLTDASVSVAVMRFRSVALRSASAPREGAEGSLECARHVARELAADDLRAVLVFSDGLDVNGSELTRGFREVLPANVVVSGGLAADGDRFQHTWVVGPDGPGTERITAVGLYGGALMVGHGSQGGWDLFGPERRVTRSRNNVLFELDGRPALELYKEYLGELAAGLPATGLLFPLALRRDAEEDASLVRTILSVDESDQSMTFAGDIPQGATVQLMRANFERLIDGAADAALELGSVAQDGPTLCIGVSCVGRRLVLGERTEEEIEAVVETLGDGARQIGFYSYGEISPVADGRCDLHNQTMTLTTLAERAA